MVNFYHRFIPKAAILLAPLNELLKPHREQEFTFPKEAQEPFRKIKEALATATLLCHPNPTAHLTLTTDASKEAVGGVIAETDRTSHPTRPLAFFSKKLSPTQQRYSTFDRELLGAYLAVKHFQHLLEGREFILYSDHKPLVHALLKNASIGSLSERQSRHLDFILQYTSDIRYIKGRIILIGHKEGNIYKMAIRIKGGNREGQNPNWKGRSTGNKEPQRALLLKTEEDKQDTLKWHLRLGHVSKDKMKTLITNKAVTGIPLQTITNFECAGCSLGRMTKTPYGTPTNREIIPGKAIHSDVCGPFSIKSLGGSLYYILFKDEATGFRAVYFINQKSEALQKFKRFISEVAQTKWKIQKLRTDNGREYVNQEFKEYLTQKEIEHEPTPSYSPALNGIAERENRTLVEKARAMLITNELPLRLWAEAVNTAAYLMNRVPNRKETTVTPYEQWYGHKPDLSHLRIYGSTAYTHVPSQLRKKLDPTSRRVIFVGYGKSTKLFRVCDPSRREVEVVRDIKFEEVVPARLVYRNESWEPDTRRDQKQHHEQISSEQEGAHQLEDSEYDSQYESAQGGSQTSEERNLPPEDDYDLLYRKQESEPETPVRRGPGRPKGAKSKPKPPPPQLQLRLRNRVTGQAMSATVDPQTYQEAYNSSESEQ
jgi:transposase InsO family protein